MASSRKLLLRLTSLLRQPPSSFPSSPSPSPAISSVSPHHLCLALDASFSRGTTPPSSSLPPRRFIPSSLVHPPHAAATTSCSVIHLGGSVSSAATLSAAAGATRSRRPHPEIELPPQQLDVVAAAATRPSAPTRGPLASGSRGEASRLSSHMDAATGCSSYGHASRGGEGIGGLAADPRRFYRGFSSVVGGAMEGAAAAAAAEEEGGAGGRGAEGAVEEASDRAPEGTPGGTPGASSSSGGGGGGSSSRGRSSGGSVDEKEIAKFDALAHEWWRRDGPHSLLHKMTAPRVSFIKEAFRRNHLHKKQEGEGDGQSHTASCPLRGASVVDVGCGGGLLCEPLARLGASVMGIDAGDENIKAAIRHAARDPSTAAITYRCMTAEDLAAGGATFDLVTSLEVLEHVNDPLHFVQTLASLCRPGGTVVVSTINRTASSFALTIAAAEHLLRWVPVGTHDWSKFVSPQELSLMMARAGLQLDMMAGMEYNPLQGSWKLVEDTSVNYIASAIKTQ